MGVCWPLNTVNLITVTVQNAYSGELHRNYSNSNTAATVKTFNTALLAHFKPPTIQ